MKRDFSDAVKYTKGLPKLSEVVKRHRAGIKNLGSRASVTIEWNLSADAIKGQVFRIVLRDGRHELDAYISRQELEHYLRTM